MRSRSFSGGSRGRIECAEQRLEHRRGRLFEEALRCGRAVRSADEVVVHGGERGQLAVAQAVLAVVMQGPLAVASFYAGAAAREEIGAFAGDDRDLAALVGIELLKRRGRIRPDELARLELAEPIDLVVLKEEWLDALESVDPFVSSRPPDEIGCLYYSSSKRAFVDPRGVADAQPHFGRPGGVLPRVESS